MCLREYLICGRYLRRDSSSLYLGSVTSVGLQRGQEWKRAKEEQQEQRPGVRGSHGKCERKGNRCVRLAKKVRGEA